MGNIIQINEQILSTKVEDAFVFCFSNFCMIMMLDEPTFFVLKQLIKNKTPEAVSIGCFKRYQNAIDICQIIVTKVLQITQQVINAQKNDIFKYVEMFDKII